MNPQMNLISCRQDFTLSEISQVLSESKNMKTHPESSQPLHGKVVMLMFLENSNGTRVAFQMAAARLGADVITIDKQKAEDQEDFAMRMIANNPNIIIARSSDNEFVEVLAQKARCAVINAGNGGDEHPVQAFTDLFTIREELGKLEDIKVALIGDLAHSRTARSLACLLALTRTDRIYFVAPKKLQMDEEIVAYVTRHGVKVSILAHLHDIPTDTNVYYFNRMQRSRWRENFEISYHGIQLDEVVKERMSENAIVMHPFPRECEIPKEFDNDQRAVYYNQAINKRLVCMALLVQMTR